MQVTRDAGTGRFTVMLSGVLWNNCTADVDCPGRARCALNASWAEYERMCSCDFTYDHIGGQCETSTSDDDHSYNAYK